MHGMKLVVSDAHEGLKAELICGDALLHDHSEHYDACMLNFFLNVFPEEQVTIMMKHATSLVRPNGMIMIADCACPQGWLPSRLYKRFYLRLAMGWYWLFGLVAWHKTCDYRQYFAPLNLTTSIVEVFRYFGFGPVLFWNIVARKS
jgi:2-polyprenyl-3-methyl-5-hydroxy-6-metoxy-1,4-benzoquinol methylase